MIEKALFEHAVTVNSYEVDNKGVMTPTTVLNICQEVAYMHSSSMGFGFERLLEREFAWVLSRVKVSAERYPAWGESLRVQTWHKGQSGIFSIRDYIFYDAENNPIIRVTSSWIIINVRTRRLQRTDHIFHDDKELQLAEYHHHAIEKEAEKIALDDHTQALQDHTVSYSDLDVNNHVNNARYMEWICDRSPQQMSPERHLYQFCINFNHEATINQIVRINERTESNDSIVIEGRVDRQSIFVARLEYSDRVK